MNKFAAMLAGVAVLGMASCSNDEPMGPAGGDKVVTSDALYLAVNITSAEDFGKADLVDSDDLANDNPNYYRGDEHEVNSARFFFFDEQGFFVAEANVWNNGQVNETNTNIEYDSKAMLVLEGLKGKNQPTYLFTVVNCPSDFQPAATLRATAAQASKILSGNASGENATKYFVMSTSSFIPTTPESEEAAKTAKYDSAYPYANKLQDTDFSKEPINLDAEGLTVLDIYVERLAAKVSMEMKNKTQKVEVTVGGNVNDETTDDEGNDDNKGKTTLYVTVTGMTVTNVETESYIAKNIDDFKGEGQAFGTSLEGWTSWNRPADFRSFWGKSMLYGKDDALAAAKYADATNNDELKAVYTYETTTTLAKLIGEGNTSTRVIDSRTPCAIISAKITSDADGNTPVDLVLFQGLYYTKEHFVKYALSRLAAMDLGLNYYYQDADSKMQQIGSEQVKLNKVDGGITGQVELVTNLGDITTLYAKKGEGDDATYEVIQDNAVGQLASRLKSFTESSKAVVYNGGNSYYVLPISHLRSNKDRATNLASAEGQWGLVRNHWYQLDIDKITKLGHGVFDPVNEDITTDTNDGDETYGMAAEIHVLSWRIVKQQVDL